MTSLTSWTVLPDTAWFSDGLGAGIGDPVTAIESRLRERFGDTGGSCDGWGRHDLDGGKFVFDVLWTPEHGTLVRLRLQMSLVGPTFQWGIIAEATGPWGWSWDSPALLFFAPARTLPWDGVPIETLITPMVTEAYRYRIANLVRSRALARAVVQAAAAARTEIHVLTTDDDPPAFPVVPLVRFLPRSFTGRVVEHRILPSAVGAVNDALSKHDLRLPAGGALVLPQRLNASADEVQNLTVPTVRWLTGRPQALVDAVVRYNSRPRLAPPVVHRALGELRGSFSLATDDEMIGELEEKLRGVRGELREARTQLATATERGRELRETAATAESAARAARARAEELTTLLTARDSELAQARAVLDRLRQAGAAAELAQSLAAAEARSDTAEDDLEAAEDLLERQAREINWLRGRAAAGGRVGEPHDDLGVPISPDTPLSWEDLQERAGRELDRVVLADVVATARSLRDHPLEARWRARAWQALLVLNSYAGATAEHGPELLPNLSAYLDWHDAPLVLPRTWYAPRESQAVMTSSRLRDERSFAVPREVDPAGRVLMTAHIRIGGVRPPAPRLHLHDGTARTGLIYVGYLGPHLRLRQTN